MRLTPLLGADLRSAFLEFNTFVSAFAPKSIPCQCLLIEFGDKVVLVDTGLGLYYAEQPKQLGWIYRLSMAKGGVQPEHTLKYQLESRGIAAASVTDIILTHMHVDHTGGLMDFPAARVHVNELEIDQAFTRKRINQRTSYYPKNWAHGAQFVPSHLKETLWGQASVTLFQQLGLRIQLVHLPGHTLGHCGVYVEMGPYRLLHAGDAALVKNVITDNFKFPWHFSAFRGFVSESNQQRINSLKFLNSLVKDGHLKAHEITCSHDYADFRKQQRRARNHFNALTE